MTIKERTLAFGKQYLTYATIGLSCAIIDLGVLNGLLYFFPTDNNTILTIYNSFAYGLAVLNSYIWNSRFTFKHQSEHSYKQFTAFIIQSIIALFISDGVLVAGVLILKHLTTFPLWLVHNAAKLLSMFLSSVASFFFNKFFVFRKKHRPREQSEL